MPDKETVEYVASLARIAIKEEEKNYLSEQLSKILDYIDKLKEVNTEGIKPLRGLHYRENIFREDKVKPFSNRENILDNFPFRDRDYIKIPKVIR